MSAVLASHTTHATHHTSCYIDDWCNVMRAPAGVPCYTVSALVEADLEAGTPILDAAAERGMEDWRVARVQTYQVGQAEEGANPGAAFHSICEWHLPLLVHACIAQACCYQVGQPASHLTALRVLSCCARMCDARMHVCQHTCTLEATPVPHRAGHVQRGAAPFASPVWPT